MDGVRKEYNLGLSPDKLSNLVLGMIQIAAAMHR
jgi:hypothetical protein